MAAALDWQNERDVVRPTNDATEKGPVYGDAATERLLALADSVAQTPSTVLLQGESGAGKEVFARFIHDQSPRAAKPFVAINCAALPPSLLESELFGHEKGSFSGALRRHIGVFERARGGTLLLDEVSEISPDMQAKLLRVLQERVLYRVGGTEKVELDIRVIATTNRDLKKSIEEGSFRLDLYYRLNVFPVRIPALRDRVGDVQPLAMTFAARSAEKMGRAFEGMTVDAIRKLERYAFPGNVRELVNIVERAVILACGKPIIDTEHIMLDAVDVEHTPNVRVVEGESAEDVIIIRPGQDAFDDIRRKVILGTLQKCGGNRTRTAEVLGLSLRTVRNRLREYRDAGISIPG